MNIGTFGSTNASLQQVPTDQSQLEHYSVDGLINLLGNSEALNQKILKTAATKGFDKVIEIANSKKIPLRENLLVLAANNAHTSTVELLIQLRIPISNQVIPLIKQCSLTIQQKVFSYGVESYKNSFLRCFFDSYSFDLTQQDDQFEERLKLFLSLGYAFNSFDPQISLDVFLLILENTTYQVIWIPYTKTFKIEEQNKVLEIIKRRKKVFSYPYAHFSSDEDPLLLKTISYGIIPSTLDYQSLFRNGRINICSLLIANFCPVSVEVLYEFLIEASSPTACLQHTIAQQILDTGTQPDEHCLKLAAENGMREELYTFVEKGVKPTTVSLINIMLMERFNDLLEIKRSFQEFQGFPIKLDEVVAGQSSSSCGFSSVTFEKMVVGICTDRFKQTFTSDQLSFLANCKPLPCIPEYFCFNKPTLFKAIIHLIIFFRMIKKEYHPDYFKRENIWRVELDQIISKAINLVLNEGIEFHLAILVGNPFRQYLFWKYLCLLKPFKDLVTKLTSEGVNVNDHKVSLFNLLYPYVKHLYELDNHQAICEVVEKLLKLLMQIGFSNFQEAINDRRFIDNNQYETLEKILKLYMYVT